MANNYYKITRKDLFDLFGRLAERYDVFVPYTKGERLHFEKFVIWEEQVMGLQASS